MDNYNPNAIWTSKQKPIPQDLAHFSAPSKPSIVADVVLHQPSSGRWVAVIIALVILLVGGGTVWYFLSRSAPAPVVLISITKPATIFVGDPFLVSVTFHNSSVVELQQAQVVLDLPDGISVVGQDQSLRTVTIPFGTVASGTTVSATSTLIAIGNSQTATSLMARATYVFASRANRSFESDASTTMAIGTPALAVTVNAPTNVVQGSAMQVSIAYANQSPDTLSDVVLSLPYPPAFTLSASSAAMTSISSAMWNLGSLPPDTSGTIMLSGTLMGTNIATSSAGQVIYSFPTMIATTIASETYSFAGPAATVTLLPAPLSLIIQANGSSNYISSPNDFMTYTLDYANHSSVAMQGVMIGAKLSSVMFDPTSLTTNGSFNSVTNTVTWSPATVPVLASLAPGAIGEVTFRVRMLKSFPIRSVNDKNYIAMVNGTISSPSVPPGVAATSTVFHSSVATKIAGGFAMALQGYRYEPTSHLRNIGPYPPTVNQLTEYTIHWTITDTSDDLQNIVVSSTLPAGVGFTGGVWSNVSTTPQFNPATGVVSWQIPAVSATAGIVAPAPQAIFQISATPSVNQVGQLLTLFSKTTAQATDIFTGLPLFSSADSVTSDLRSDPVATQSHSGSVQN